MTDTQDKSIGFGSLLLLLFVGLKLGGVITWSWWWVLSPAWLPLALFLGLAVSILTIRAFFKAIG